MSNRPSYIPLTAECTSQMAARPPSSCTNNNSNSTAANPATNPASNTAPASTKIDPDHVGLVGKTVDRDWSHLYKPFNISKNLTATNITTSSATDPTAPSAVASFLSTIGNSSTTPNSPLSLSPGTEPTATASIEPGAVVAMNADLAVLPSTLAAASSFSPTASASWSPSSPTASTAATSLSGLPPPYSPPPAAIDLLSCPSDEVANTPTTAIIAQASVTLTPPPQGHSQPAEQQ